MPEPITTQGETPSKPTEPVAPVEQPPASKVEQPASEQTEEPFDKDRAMKTINNLREVEKQAKKDAKELETLRAKENAAASDDVRKDLERSRHRRRARRGRSALRRPQSHQ